MENWPLQLLAFLYGLGGIVTFVGFMPTIIDLWEKKPSANLITYIVWFSTTLITSLYAIFVVKDLLFIIVINLQLLACLIILVLRARIRT